MPFAIDTEALNSKKVLDIANPPTKNIPHAEFPRVIYLHPKDKSKEHLSRVVANEQELEMYLAQGWKKEAHVPQGSGNLPEGFEPDFDGVYDPDFVPKHRGRKPKNDSPDAA